MYIVKETRDATGFVRYVSSHRGFAPAHYTCHRENAFPFVERANAERVASHAPRGFSVAIEVR